MGSKIALITGVTGQDGSYLTRLLISKGYEVHGLKRRSSSLNTSRIDDIYIDPHQENIRFFMHYGDLTDSSNLTRVIKNIQPDEIYNMAAQSHVQVSFETSEYTANADAIGTLRILEAIRTLGLEKKTKFYQASTSELFGKTAQIPQNESTAFYPRSPYAAAKLYAYWITVNYREAYGIHASNGILFNHESPMRGETFVTQKIALAAANIKLKKQKYLYLGNLDAKRDWGHAKDYVEGMWRIVQHKDPCDFVLATGRTESIRFFAEKAFKEVNIDIEWSGKGAEEIGIDKKNGNTIIKVDPKYFRPTEVDILVGDYSKASKVLGWKPTKTLENIIEEMVRVALHNAKQTKPEYILADF